MTASLATSIAGLVAAPALRLGAFGLGRLQLADWKLQGTVAPRQAGAGPGAQGVAPAAGPDAWTLGPLGTANGRIRAKIVDAELFFDADVTVSLQQGQVDFNQATVEHVGPDSRMGVSPAGIYVDAPNGRSLVYRFDAPPAAGVEFERRGLLPGPWSVDRGRLQLQAFAETLLRQLRAGHGLGITQQAQALLARTTLAGEVRLGDGPFTAPGLQATFAGRAEGHNVVRLSSESLDDGLTVQLDGLLLRQVTCVLPEGQLRCDEIAGSLTLRLDAEGAAWRCALTVPALTLTGIVVAGTELAPSGTATQPAA